jgi:hypothetical protein
VAEQAADPVRDAVALAFCVDDERPPPCAPEHQAGAQAGGTRSDDDAIPSRVHASTVTRHRPCVKMFCHVGKLD